MAFFTVAVHATPTWEIQRLDADTGYVSAIALDSNNNPHILYSDYENGNPHNPQDVMYASWTGLSWKIQTVVEGDARENTHLYNFVLDSNNNPYILYDGVNGLMCASWTGSNWTLQTIDKEGSYGGFIALDSAGNLHVAYKVNLAPSNYPQGITKNIAMLKYANLNGTNWDTQTVDSPMSYLDGVYLAFDSNNRPHILYGYDNGSASTSVKYTMWNGSSWNTKIILPNVLLYGNMALDSKGYPDFIYEKNYLNTLVYASWNGSACNTQTIASNANPGMPIGFLTLDTYNYPHIDFFNESSQSLIYARWTGRLWDIQTVGPNSLAIEAGPIAVDSNGNAHITYSGFHQSSPNLVNYCMYATVAEPIYTPTPFPTQVSSSTFLTFSSLIIISVLIIIIAATLVYIWKKKIKKP